jgi:hypothetical protein
MGPLLLVDKSFLRSISPREAKALHKHYSVLLPPILLEELISSLSDETKEEQARLKEIYQLLAKASSIGSFTLHDAREMIDANLHGVEIGLTTQIPRFGGKEVSARNGSKGVLLEPSFEEKLLESWSRGEFSELDKQVSGQLKREFEKYNLPGTQEEMRKLHPENTKFKTIQEIADVYDRFSGAFSWPMVEQMARWAYIDGEELAKIKAGWEKRGSPDFKDWAPYAHFCGRVFFIYYIAVTAALVPVGKSDKSLIDLFYFMYLPFCHAFVSGDRFHQNLFPFFKRPEQEFIWGPDLKADLGVIASFHESLNDKDRLQYEIEFGHYPPPILGSITNELWQRQMRAWSPGSGNKAAGRSAEENKAELERLKREFGF